MSHRVRNVLYVLLFALVCSLGDGPFLDELESMTDGQGQVQLAAQHPRANADQPAALVVLYASLMSTADVPASCWAARHRITEPLPAYTPRAYDDPALSPPARPPRRTLA